MNDPEKQINLDDIIAAHGMPKSHAELETILSAAYDTGALEAAAAPVAPGDPAAAERDAAQFAIAATLIEKDEAAGRAALRGVLKNYLARVG